MKSRTILKSQYELLGKFLCKKYVEKNKLLEKKKEAQKKITDLLVKDYPDIVRQAYEAYPGYFVLQNFEVLYLPGIMEACTESIKQDVYHEQRVNRVKSEYSENTISIANEIWKNLVDKGFTNGFGVYLPYRAEYYIESEINKFSFNGINVKDLDNITYSNDWINVLGDTIFGMRNPEIGEEMKNIIVEWVVEIAKYNMYKKSLSCAFSTITTTNMLKYEIPEAYAYFYEQYGEQYEKEDAERDKRNKSEKKQQCDNIEFIRASIS